MNDFFQEDTQNVNFIQSKMYEAHKVSSFSQNRALKVKLRMVNSKPAQSTDALMWEKNGSHKFQPLGHVGKLHNNTRGRNGSFMKWLLMHVWNFLFLRVLQASLFSVRGHQKSAGNAWGGSKSFSYNNMYKNFSANVQLI